MKFFNSRRFYINVITALIISMTLILPMILGMMGYDIFNRRPVPVPSRIITFWEVGRQYLINFMLVFILMTINTVRNTRLSVLYKIFASLSVTTVFYLLFALFRIFPPVPVNPFAGNERNDHMPEWINHPYPEKRLQMLPQNAFRSPMADVRRMTELLYVFIITFLAGQLIEMVNVRQQMQIENEKLRSENLQSRYDMLLNQINPHFFFNSLNSLASLVRDGRSNTALRYIDELSDTYRYAMQSSGKELVAVNEELDSLKAYSYLLQIRFEDKLFIEINIDEDAGTMLIPVLSLQPLIENVVKHNIISSDNPLTITITGNKEAITVINPVRPRNISGKKSGTGLNNLAARYKLLTGSDLLIEKGSDIFSVTLPLIKPM